MQPLSCMLAGLPVPLVPAQSVVACMPWHIASQLSRACLPVQCDACGSLLNPTELINPKCKLTGAFVQRATQALATGPRTADMFDCSIWAKFKQASRHGFMCVFCEITSASLYPCPHRALAGSTPVVRQTKHIFLDLPKLSGDLQAYIDRTSTLGGWSSNCVQVGPRAAAGWPALACAAHALTTARLLGHCVFVWMCCALSCVIPRPVALPAC